MAKHRQPDTDKDAPDPDAPSPDPDAPDAENAPDPDAETTPPDDEKVADDADAELRSRAADGDGDAEATAEDADGDEEDDHTGEPVGAAPGTPGELVLDHHERPMIPGSTYTATYLFEDADEVEAGAGETELTLELDTPRGRRSIPAVRTGAAGTVSVTFPVELAGTYRARLVDGSKVLATLDFTV